METIILNDIIDMINILKNFREDILQTENILNSIFENIEKNLENKIIINLNSPILISGDIHGNFDDVKTIIIKFINLYNRNIETKILFLGDYIDRGDYSFEVITARQKL